MDGLLSFLRFLIPGAIFGIWTFCGWMLIEAKSLKSALSTFQDGNVLFGVVFIGATGYLLSQTYRFFYPIHGLDHINLVNDLIERNYIEVTPSFNRRKRLVRINNHGRHQREDAYQILTVIWHQNKNLFDMEKGVFQAHILNSNGAVMIATKGAAWILLTGYLGWSIFDPMSMKANGCHVLLYWIFLLVIAELLNVARERTVRMYTSWFESAVVSVFSNAQYNPDLNNANNKTLNGNVDYFQFIANIGLEFNDKKEKSIS